MPFYEIIYEPGTKSVAFYEDDEEAKRALSEHHKRAVSGIPATPQSTSRMDLGEGEVPTVGTWPAERIKKVLVYDKHPGDYAEDQIVSVDELQTVIQEKIEESSLEGMVHVPTVAAAVRDTSSAIVPDTGVHDSQFRMQENGTLDLSFLTEVEGQ